MAGKTREGKCHLCGQMGPLSFEHVPPRAAFNNRPVVLMAYERAIRLGPDEHAPGRLQQRGMGGYTLCERCNSNTGKWYGSQYVEWCSQGMELLIRSGGMPTLFYIYQIYPLAVIKQIAAMFFSINSETFLEANEELARFVLNKQAKYLSPKYRFFIYYCGAGQLRSIGGGAILKTDTGKVHLISELAFPPFGYVLSLNSPPPDDRLFEISHFARYDYEQLEDMQLRLPTLPTHLATIPGDYRTKRQILEESDASIRHMQDIR